MVVHECIQNYDEKLCLHPKNKTPTTMHAQCETPKPCIEDYIIGVKSQIYNDLLTRHNWVFSRNNFKVNEVCLSKQKFFQKIWFCNTFKSQIKEWKKKTKTKNTKVCGEWKIRIVSRFIFDIYSWFL